MATFVLNDESKLNSYGFRIPNKGIDLKRFKGNPVMLDQHYNSTSNVLGKWKNLRIEGTQLLADDEFDEEDDQAKKIKGKVERGYIRGASMGVTFLRDHMQRTPDGNFELSKCELFEASIVAVPSNANAVRLFVAETGELISETQVKLTLSALTQANFNTNQMEKLVLTAACLVALGLSNADNVSAVDAAIVKLSADYEKEKELRKTAEQALAAQQLTLSSQLVDDAIVAGKLTADMKDSWMAFAKSDYALAAKMISSMPGKKSLGATVNNPAGGGTLDVKTPEDFQKLSFDQQLSFKKEHPEDYKRLFS